MGGGSKVASHGKGGRGKLQEGGRWQGGRQVDGESQEVGRRHEDGEPWE